MELLKKFLSVIAWGFVAIFAITIVAGFLTVVVLFSKGMSDSDFGSYSVKTANAVGVVELKGEILSSDKLRAGLKRYLEDDKIKAIVVRIDSPGGSVGASEEIYQSIKLADQKKPVVCSLSNIAASGGLYASLGCRKVITNQGTLTGSIGVILMIPNVSSVLNRFGLEMTVVKSGKFKDAGSPFHAMSEEEKALLQSLVDQTYEQFIRAVSEARGIAVEEVKKFADGRILLGEEAVRLGLAHQVGGVYQAAKAALEAINVQAEPEIIEPKTGGLPLWLAESEKALFSWIEARKQVRLLYQVSF